MFVTNSYSANSLWFHETYRLIYIENQSKTTNFDELRKVFGAGW